MSLSNLLIIFSSSFMALFPVINPLGNGFVVNGFFTDLDPQQRKAAIQKLTLNFIMIGVGTLVIGHLFLLIFGLAIPVIQLGGGILICKTAMELLGDSGSSDKEEEASKNVDGFRWKNIEQKIFYPITFPISIGPGSISVIFTLMASASVKGKLLQTGINYLVIALVIISMVLIGRKLMNPLLRIVFLWRQKKQDFCLLRLSRKTIKRNYCDNLLLIISVLPSKRKMMI